MNSTMITVVIQLIVSLSVLLATYHRDDVRRHLADLLTLTARPSPSSSLPERRRSRDVIDIRHRRDVTGDLGSPARFNNGIVRLYNRRRRQFVAVATRYDVTVTSRRARRGQRSVHFSGQLSCSTCRFEMLFLCHEAPQFFRRCPLPPSLSGRTRSSTWIYGLVMFRSVTSRGFICMDRHGRVVTKVLTERSSKPEVLSCAFYNVLHDRHYNVVYNFRFPVSAARCRLAEWRRWQHSPGERRHCRKWFMGTSRDRHGGRVTVVRGRAATRGAMTVVYNGSLANLRRVNKSRLNGQFLPPIRLEALDSSAF